MTLVLSTILGCQGQGPTPEAPAMASSEAPGLPLASAPAIPETPCGAKAEIEIFKTKCSYTRVEQNAVIPFLRGGETEEHLLCVKKSTFETVQMNEWSRNLIPFLIVRAERSFPRYPVYEDLSLIAPDLQESYLAGLAMSLNPGEVTVCDVNLQVDRSNIDWKKVKDEKNLWSENTVASLNTPKDLVAGR